MLRFDLFVLYNCSNEWYTSGRRTTFDETQWIWEGIGKNVEGDQFWIDETHRKMKGDYLIYGWNGKGLLVKQKKII